MDPIENPTGPAPKGERTDWSPLLRLAGGILMAGIAGGSTALTGAWSAGVTDWKKLAGAFGGGFIGGVGLYLKQSPLKV